jgi:hypothetical protein
MPFVLNWQDAEPEAGALRPLAWRDEGALVASWLDPKGMAIGESFGIDPPQPEPRETTDGDGSFVIQSQPRPMVLPADPPAGATALLLRRGEAPIARFALGALRPTGTARAPEERRFLPAPGPQAAIRVVSECYSAAQRQKFFNDVAAMRAYWIANFLPFRNPQIAAKLTFEALFWDSGSPNGNFATRFPTVSGDRIVKGEDARKVSRQSRHFNQFEAVCAGAHQFVVGARRSWRQCVSHPICLAGCLGHDPFQRA